MSPGHRVLVTGASGFIGRHALAPLLGRGFEVCAIARRVPDDALAQVTWLTADLLDDAQRARAVEQAAASHLLHLAWYVEHGRFWEAHENVAWTAATLRLAQEFTAAGGRRAVMAGTCAEYAWGGAGVLSEAASPTLPVTLYGVCKDATRRVVEHVVPELAWGRVFFLYGPGEAPGRLVAAVARALVAGERARTGDGTQIRDFMHVADVAAAFAALLDSSVAGAVNVASGEGRPLRDVIEAIGVAAGCPELLDIGALPPRPDEPRELVADVRRLRDEVGWAPLIGLQEGLARTVEWWRDQPRVL